MTRLPRVHLKTRLDREILRAVAGRAALPQRRSPAYAAVLRSASNLPGALAHLYADAETSQRAWNAFHAVMAGNSQICTCRPYLIGSHVRRECKKPAMCPACGARQFDELLKAIKSSRASSVAAAIMLAKEATPAAATVMCATARELLRRAKGTVSACLLRIYPHVDKRRAVIGAIVVTGGGNMDVMMDGAHRLRPHLYDTGEDGLVDFTRRFAAYPFRLLQMDHALVRNAYAATRGLRSSISGRKVKHDVKDTGERLISGFALGAANLAVAAGDLGGCLPQLGCGGIDLHRETAVAEVAG